MMVRKVGSTALLVLCIAAQLCACAPESPGDLIDLTDRSWLIRPGFSPEHVAGLPRSPPTKEIREFPVSPNAIFGKDVQSGVTEYTLQTTFRVEQPGRLPYALHFATIGENWRIYLNGQVVADGYRISGGELHGRLSLRSALFYVAPATVRQGTNLLTVRLAGALPATRVTPNTALGFYLKSPYVFGPYASVSAASQDWLGALLPPLFLLMGLYALVLFIYRARERFPLYLGLTSIFSAAYFLSRLPPVINWAAKATGDTAWLMRVEYFSLSLAGASLLLLLERFLFGANRLSRAKRVIVILWTGCALMQLVVPFPYTDGLLLLWQVSALPAMGIISATVVVAAFRGKRDAKRLLPGMAALATTVMWDIIDAAVLFTGIRFGAIGYAFFMFMVALASATRITRIRAHTEQDLAELRRQEEQVRGVFEAAFEALVVHDEGKIIDANPAFYRMFEVSPSQLAGGGLGDLLVPDSPECDFTHPRDRICSCQGYTRKGKRFRVETRSRPHDYRGHAVIVTAVRDVEAWRALTDELQERQQELQIMVRAMRGREERYEALLAELEALHNAKHSEA